MLCTNRKTEALQTYRTALAHFEDKAVFFANFDDDFQYLAQYSISQGYYQSIKAQLLKA